MHPFILICTVIDALVNYVVCPMALRRRAFNASRNPNAVFPLPFSLRTELLSAVVIRESKIGLFVPSTVKACWRNQVVGRVTGAAPVIANEGR